MYVYTHLDIYYYIYHILQYACVYNYIHLYTYTCMHFSLSLSIYIYIHAYIYIDTYVHTCIYIHRVRGRFGATTTGARSAGRRQT